MMISVVVLPSSVFVFILFVFLCLFHVGEITQGSIFITTLVLPSLNRICSVGLNSN